VARPETDLGANVSLRSKDRGYSLSALKHFPVPFFFLLLPLVVLLSGCQRDRILFSEAAGIAGGWTTDDTIRFGFTAPDTARRYDLRLEITHDEDYAWQNLYVRIGTSFPGDSVRTDILSLELSDRSGGWAGRCRQGKCKLVIPLQQNLRFPSPGNYALTFNQYMRQEVVPGILGLKLTVAEAKGIKGSTADGG
jgi:gliding motility-associated lipoprotein GldH